MAKQRNAKGHFVKSGTKRRRRSTASKALVRTNTRTVYRQAPRPARRRRSRGGDHSGVKMVSLGIAAAAVGYLTGSQGPKFITDTVAKVPGAKTFGNAAALGGVCLVVNHFRPNKWLKLAGIAGIAVAAVQLGTQAGDFKWVGEGEGDVADLDMGDEDE